MSVFVIAEIGINHNGSVARARQLIALAKEAGADAVKLQTHIPDEQMLKDTQAADYVGESIYDLLSRVMLNLDEHVELKQYADSLDIEFMSTPFSRKAVDWLERIGVKRYKIGSGELTKHDLLGYVASKGKPMIVSSGMSTIDQVTEAMGFLKALGVPVTLLQCTSLYPTPHAKVNLRVMRDYRDRFGCPVGLSDHTLDNYAALGAVALGATVIEKHFTLDRDDAGPDHKCSMDPQDLKQLVEGVRAIEECLGSGAKELYEDEKPVVDMARHSVVASTGINHGDRLTVDNVCTRRPGTGIPAEQLNRVLGRRTKVDIAPETIIGWEMLE